LRTPSEQAWRRKARERACRNFFGFNRAFAAARALAFRPYERSPFSAHIQGSLSLIIDNLRLATVDKNLTLEFREELPLFGRVRVCDMRRGISINVSALIESG
jgi:hypothetical protein